MQLKQNNNFAKIVISPGNIFSHYEIAQSRMNAREVWMLEQRQWGFQNEVAQTSMINLMQLQLGFTEVIDLIR